jgi:hypothetical protein
MNTHLQLLWKSVFAPRAAVDLARQHSNTAMLARAYLLATVSLAILFDVVWFNFFAAGDRGMLVGASIIDTPIFWTVASAFSFVLSYVTMKWYWSRVAPPGTTGDSINAAIACSFAITLVLLIPQYTAAELQASTTDWTVTLVSIGVLLVSFFYTVLYFSHALNITLGRSLVSNISLLFLTITVAFVIAVILILLGFVVGLIFNVPLFGVIAP